MTGWKSTMYEFGRLANWLSALGHGRVFQRVFNAQVMKGASRLFMRRKSQ